MVKVVPETEREGRKSMSFGWFIQTETSTERESRIFTRLISTVSTMAINSSEVLPLLTPFYRAKWLLISNFSKFWNKNGDGDGERPIVPGVWVGGPLKQRVWICLLSGNRPNPCPLPFTCARGHQ